MTKIERMIYEMELWDRFLGAGGDPTVAAGSSLIESWDALDQSPGSLQGDRRETKGAYLI